jgi:hypothetical protein
VAEAAGWFADPSGKINTFRWWDGQSWTRWLSADAGAPDPGPVPAVGRPATATATADFPPPDPSTSSGPMLAEPVEARHPPAKPSDDPRPTPAEDLAAFAPPDPADRVVRLPAAAAVIVGGVLLAIIAVGAIISLTADRPLTGPAVPPPAPTEPPPAVEYDPTARTYVMEELKVVLPTAPFSCDTQPRDVPGVFPSSFGCTAPVHIDYNEEKSDWVAATGMGLVDEELKLDPDLTAIAALTFNAVVVRNYDLDEITIKKRKTERLAEIAPEGKALLVSAEIHYDYRGLASRYDRVVVAVFALESGRHAAWYALRPNDSPKDVTEALGASARTVTARK